MNRISTNNTKEIKCKARTFSYNREDEIGGEQIEKKHAERNNLNDKFTMQLQRKRHKNE